MSNAVIDPLERRRLFAASLIDGVLTVGGTGGDDVIEVFRAKSNTSKLNIAVNGVLQQFILKDVAYLNVRAFDGNDTIKLSKVFGDILAPMKIFGERGGDTIISDVSAPLTIRAGADNDAIHLRDVLGFAAVYGEGGNDTIQGAGGDYLFDCGAGNDMVLGGTGDDVIYGGDGDDTCFGGAGDDWLLGEAGDDNLHGDAGRDTLEGGLGGDQLDGGIDDDHLDGGYDADTLLGGDGRDTLRGDFSDGTDAYGWTDLLYGGAGDDRLDGFAGNDLLIGGDGADTLSGGFGDDDLDGGLGVDLLYGNTGNDDWFGVDASAILADNRREDSGSNTFSGA